jgi:hypothetical protein
MTVSKHEIKISNNVFIDEIRDTGGKNTNIRTKTIPEKNSTRGYCQEIFDLQFLQAPFWDKKLKIGINSYQLRVFPHDMHLERPPTFLPVLYLRATTFKKLPTIMPNRNANRVKYVSIYFGPMQ